MHVKLRKVQSHLNDLFPIYKLKYKNNGTIEDLKQNKGKSSRDMDGQNWGGLKWLAFG